MGSAPSDHHPTHHSPGARDDHSSSSTLQPQHGSGGGSGSGGALPKRGVSYDLPNDNSLGVTEDQLASLGSIQQQLWKALRFKIQRFFVPNVTTPQVGRIPHLKLRLVH
jgi:hypothetical protein